MLHTLLESQLQRAVAGVVPDANPALVLVRPCPDPRFGDYQSNALIALAKERKRDPRQLAAAVLEKLDVAAWCSRVDIAGPGFLNFHLKVEAIIQSLQSAQRGEHLFFQRSTRPGRVVIDFSSPNVAKPMHVGHIRSTLLGDCLTRVLRLLGHEVVTDNHIGDWGTQFGMLLVGWKRDLDRTALEKDALSEMDRVYKKVNAEAQANPATLDLARQELVKLQAGEPDNLQLWREMLRLSQAQFEAIYRRLGVTFDHCLGESFYNPQLKAIVDELVRRQIARESAGAICVFSDGSFPAKEDPFLKTRDGELQPEPFIIQKSDGAANYATTDLATLAYRLTTWNPQEIIYVTDARQQLHFRQLFATFRRWHPEAAVQLSHIWFGSILGDDGKPFKSRSGETVRLSELLDEAEERAFALVTEKNPALGETERRAIARFVGIGAVKYADLLPNRQSDYIFSWEKMLALTGNTSPYLQYAYARTRSVLRKAGIDDSAAIKSASGGLSAPEEIALAKHLLRFGLVLESVAEEYRPNFLCNYLYDLAGLFSRFWENCPVLKAEEPERSMRLSLSDLTGRVLKQGLGVLGIETLEQM